MTQGGECSAVVCLAGRELEVGTDEYPQTGEVTLEKIHFQPDAVRITYCLVG